MFGAVVAFVLIVPAGGGFWLDSTQDEVLEAMGRAPARIQTLYKSTQEWVYGETSYSRDKIVFKDGRVWSYSNSQGKLKLKYFKEPNKTFWLGSGESGVLSANGAPTSIYRSDYSDAQTWYYGSYPQSKVEFKSRLVSTFDNNGQKLNLPKADPDFPAFSVGATEEEVLAVMGAPASIFKSSYSDATTWFYRSSGYQSVTVNFSGGKVKEYDSPDGSLRVVLTSRASADPSSTRVRGVDMGSSVDDVLLVMGTPSGIKWDTPSYRDARLILKYRNGSSSSSVEFGCIREGGYWKPDRVVGYDNGGRNLLISLTPNGLLLAAKLLDSTATDAGTKVYSSPVANIDSEVARFSTYAAPKRLSSYSGAYYSPSSPPVAENGSSYGQISEATGRAKTVYVRSYFRSDGTYVRSHYRSSPRRR